MMKQMRENTKIILWVVVVAFVITIFAVWGLDLQSGGIASRQNIVGRVNGVPITPQVYQTIYAQMVQQFRASTPGSDLTSIQQEILRDQAWESIVSNIITSEQIKRLGITVSDEEILNFIRTSPPPEVQQYFLDANGRFDFAAYQAALNNPDADWTAVEELVRQRIPVVKLNQYLMAQVHVSDGEVRRVFEEENVKMTARYVEFPIEQADIGHWSPSDADVSAYYESHRDQYEQPEKAVLQYVRIPRAPSDRDRFDLAYTAEIVRRQAVGGEDFATLAKTYSESHTAEVGGETGFLGEGQRDAAVMNALATMKPGDVSEPITTGDGVYVVQLIASKKDKAETTYNMREIFLKLTVGPETSDSLAAAAAAVQEKAVALGDLSAAARARGLEAARTDPFATGMPVPGLGFVPAVSRFAFAGAVGAISGVISDDSAFYVCRIESRTPPSTVPLADVAEAVKKTLVRDRKLAATMVKAGAFRRSAANPEVAFEQAAAQYGYSVAKTDSFTVTQPVVKLGPYSAFAHAALSTPVGEVTPPVEDLDSVYVIRVESRGAPREAAFRLQAAQIRERIYQEKVQAYVAYWYEELRRNSTIEDFRDAS